MYYHYHYFISIFVLVINVWQSRNKHVFLRLSYAQGKQEEHERVPKNRLLCVANDPPLTKLIKKLIFCCLQCALKT